MTDKNIMHKPGDICLYAFGGKNKSRAIVEIVRLLERRNPEEPAVAEIKFRKVMTDDSGNGYFNFLLKTGNMMNASLEYLTVLPLTAEDLDNM